MKYNIVLFDADGTLFDFHRSEYEAIWQTMESYGINASDELVADYSRINDSMWKMLERGEIEKSVLTYRRFEIFCEKHQFDINAQEMSRRYMKALSEKAYLLDGAEELCQKLYGKVRMYIITNGVEFVQRGRYALSGMAKYFEDFFISGAVGYEKPAREYFEYVEAHIDGFDIANTLVVGDSLTSDIRGGINYGIDTCWYNPAGKPTPEDMDITYITSDFSEICNIISGEEENA